MSKKLTVLKIFNAITFIMMVTVNALANIMPINNITTGEVSDSYPNLFAPAPITFAIWGVIYLLLALFVLYSLGLFKGKKGYSTEAIGRIKLCFIISSVANSVWIFAWHNKMISLTLIMMAIIFVTLMLTYIRIGSGELTAKEKVFVKLPFSVYFGWITIASIANITTYLVSIGWNGFNAPEQMWMIIVVAAGLLICGTTTVLKKDVAYGLVILWAYTGILIKHLSKNGFAGEYTGVIIAVSISLLLLAAGTILAAVKQMKKPKT